MSSDNAFVSQTTQRRSTRSGVSSLVRLYVHLLLARAFSVPMLCYWWGLLLTPLVATSRQPASGE
jgi:hypothetical protein